MKKGCTLVLGETDPDLVPIFTTGARPACCERDVDFGWRSNVSAFGGRMLELFTPGARYPDVFVPLYGAHQGDNAAVALAAAEAFVGAPLDVEAVRERVLARAIARAARARRPASARVARRRAQRCRRGGVARALADEFAPTARTLVVGPAPREGSERDAARARSRRCRQLVCAPAAEPARLDPARIAAAAIELGFPGRAASRSSTRRPTRFRSALLTTPADGEIVVTGSLYFVGAARSILVDR